MKVKKEIIEAAVLKLINQITQTMPNTMYQFLLGGVGTFTTMKSQGRIMQMLDHVSDEHGLVEVEQLERLVDGAFTASGGKVQIELFNQPGILSMFVKPITVTVTKDDIDIILDEVKKNCVSNEVSLGQVKQKDDQVLAVQKISSI